MRLPARLAFLLALPALVHCGYTLVQTDAPHGAHYVLVEPFREEVPVGISADLTGAFAERLAAGGVRLTQNREAADAVLSGSVVTTRTAVSPTSAGLGSRVMAYRLAVKVRVRLVSIAGKTLWTGTTNLFEDFLPGSSGDEQTIVTEANRRRALSRLANRAAEELHVQLVMNSALD